MNVVHEFWRWFTIAVLPELPAKLAILALVAFFGYQAATVESRTAEQDFRLSKTHFSQIK